LGPDFFPFPTGPDDHCESPLESYRDILPFFTRDAEVLKCGNARETLRNRADKIHEWEINCSIVEDVEHSGIMPINAFPVISTNLRVVLWPIEAGIDPLMMLPKTKKRSRRGMFPIAGLIVPEKVLLSSMRSLSSLKTKRKPGSISYMLFAVKTQHCNILRSPIVSGIVPVTALFNMFMVTRVDRYPISCGMVPLNKLVAITAVESLG
jgi:hypothetical protein